MSSRLADCDTLALLEQEDAVAEPLHGREIVCHEHDRSALALQAPERVEALLLEAGVADREHLVDEIQVGLRLDHRGEAEPHLHAGGVVLQLQVDEPLQLRELDDRGEPAPGLARDTPSSAAFTTTLSRAVSSGLNPTPSSMNGDTRPDDGDRAAVGRVDPGQALEERALAGAVAPDDAEELALGDLERDVSQRVESAPATTSWGEHALLERGGAVDREPERLPDA